MVHQVFPPWSGSPVLQREREDPNSTPHWESTTNLEKSTELQNCASCFILFPYQDPEKRPRTKMLLFGLSKNATLYQRKSKRPSPKSRRRCWSQCRRPSRELNGLVFLFPCSQRCFQYMLWLFGMFLWWFLVTPKNFGCFWFLDVFPHGFWQLPLKSTCQNTTGCLGLVQGRGAGHHMLGHTILAHGLHQPSLPVDRSVSQKKTELQALTYKSYHK